MLSGIAALQAVMQLCLWHPLNRLCRILVIPMAAHAEECVYSPLTNRHLWSVIQALVLKQLTENTELTDATWGNANTENVITSLRLKLGKATSDIMVARSTAGSFF